MARSKPGRPATPPVTAEAALVAVSPGLADALALHPPWPGATRTDRTPYEALSRAIVFQQLAGKAAATIFGRYVALFPEPFPAPEAVAEADPEHLRTAGLSRQKAAALQDLARKTLQGVVPEASALADLSDEEIVDRLTAVRGVGRWTVEMYLLFTLGRADVWPVDDLGVRRGAELLLGEVFTPKTLGAAGDPFRPWRSALAWHCWRAVDRSR
jgi:DNA-3-methyladenine glycosylase II